MAGWIGYVSSNPFFKMTPEQSIFTKEGEDVLIPIVNSDIEFSKGSFLIADGMKSPPSCLEDGTGCTSYIKPAFIEAFKKANKDDMNPYDLTCPPEFPVLCDSMKEQSIAPIIESAEFPIQICHNLHDKIAIYKDMIRLYPNNRYLSELPTQQQWNKVEEKRGEKFKHQEASMICIHLAMFEVITRRSV